MVKGGFTMNQLEVKGSKVYTSRYANKELNNDKYVVVAISLGLPKFKINYNIDIQVYSLAPGRDYFRSGNNDYFTSRYREDLEALGVNEVINILSAVAQEGKDIVLLCFEDINKELCHRTILAEWFKEKTGQEIVELNSNKRAEKLDKLKNQISFW